MACDGMSTQHNARALTVVLVVVTQEHTWEEDDQQAARAHSPAETVSDV